MSAGEIVFAVGLGFFFVFVAWYVWIVLIWGVYQTMCKRWIKWPKGHLSRGW